MFNMALFKIEWRNSYKLLIIFALILSMYTSLIITMYDPKLGSILEEFAKSMPEMMSAVGMSGPTATLIQFMSTYLYGFIMIAFPLIFVVILSMRLLVKKVDNGSMAYLLSSGNDRYCVWFTQLCVLLSNLLVLILYCTCLGLLCSQIFFSGNLDIPAYLRLNLGVLILHIALASICFLASCLCNEYKNASLWGAGIPVLCILIQMLANMKGDLEALKYVTLLTLFDAQKLIINDSEAWFMIGGLAVLAGVCFISSGIVFKRKNISL